MERKIRENPYFLTSQSPEILFNPPCRRFVPTENHRPITITDQAIESAFSRLSLSPDFGLHAETPSFIGLQNPLAASAESVPLPMAFGEKHQALFWAQNHAQSNNGGVNGPFGFFGAHQKINVGPEGTGLLWGGPYLDAGDNNLMKFQQRQDFCRGGAYDNYDFSSSLHGKQPFSRKVENCFPAIPLPQQSSFSSPMPSSCSNNQQLYKWEQQLTPANMRGRIVPFAKDQMWSSILDLKLDEGLSEEQIEMVLAEVLDSLGDLMRDQFGSHFVQNLFVACNEDQRTRIIIALTKFPFKLISICLNSHGVLRAKGMQKVLEKLITPQQISFVVSALSPGAIALATDPNGQHVIQYCVKNFLGEYNKHLFNEIADNCFKIATNKSGCCVLQSCMDNSHGEVRKRLISEIIANSVHLAKDPYGNYVVQHLLGMRMQEVTADILRRFQGCFLSLSCNKYASNVVEKFLLESGENHSATIIMELLASPNASMLLLDPFGNFVIQSALSAAKDQVRDALLNLIKVNAASMQSNLYGKKILAWLEKSKLQNA